MVQDRRRSEFAQEESVDFTLKIKSHFSRIGEVAFY